MPRQGRSARLAGRDVEDLTRSPAQAPTAISVPSGEKDEAVDRSAQRQRRALLRAGTRVVEHDQPVVAAGDQEPSRRG